MRWSGFSVRSGQGGCKREKYRISNEMAMYYARDFCFSDQLKTISLEALHSATLSTSCFSCHQAEGAEIREQSICDGRVISGPAGGAAWR